MRFEVAHESVVNKREEIFFSGYKGNLIILFFTTSKFKQRLRMVASSFNVYKIFGGGNCFVLVCKCNEIFLFFVTEGNLTPLFFTRA